MTRDAAARLSVEIAVSGAGGARIAIEEGADRIELCTCLEVGGLTPSAATIEQAVAVAAGRTGFVHVLIRPRPGDFVYDRDEVATMVRDIERARDGGVAGVVVRALTASGSVDHEIVAALRDAAGDRQVTFHRAIDVVSDPRRDVARLAEAGVARVLTSGGAARVRDGLAVIRDLARERIEVMAGGGLTVADVPAAAAAGAAAVHLSARRIVRGHPSGPGGGAAEHAVTDRRSVREVVAAARSLA